jgi:hypothetical protein
MFNIFKTELKRFERSKKKKQIEVCIFLAEDPPLLPGESPVLQDKLPMSNRHFSVGLHYSLHCTLWCDFIAKYWPPWFPGTSTGPRLLHNSPE